MSAPFRNPAHNLVGKTLNDGWQVESKVAPGPDATGGQFSVGYIACVDRKQRAFCKVLDYAKAFSPGVDTARVLQALTTAFNFERDLLNNCATRGMRRIVRILGTGTIEIPEADYPKVAQYMLFELASGDVRKLMDSTRDLDYAWILRSLHQISVGLMQLHNAGIAHQDLKPSNILNFEGSGLKIGDVGRASILGVVCPHDHYDFPGDYTYAPPEFLYGHVCEDWKHRRLCADLYLLGSMVLFMIAQTTATAEIFQRVSHEHRPRRSGGTWNQPYKEVLPYIREAFDEFLSTLPTLIGGELGIAVQEVVKQLCDPDPELRGMPARNAAKRTVSLDRVVSKFDVLARKAELKLLEWP